jgi:hypothetical protein
MDARVASPPGTWRCKPPFGKARRQPSFPEFMGSRDKPGYDGGEVGEECQSTYLSSPAVAPGARPQAPAPMMQVRVPGGQRPAERWA